jgi:Flp pilus assembly protein TadD
LATSAGHEPASAVDALNAATAAAQRGEAFAALDLVRKAAARPDVLGEQWAAAVKLCSQLGDEDAALLAARRLWQETPRSAQVGYILARTLEATGRIDEAIAVLVPFARSGAMAVHDLLRLVRLHLFAGQPDLAQSLCRRLLREQPWNPGVWEQLAQAKQFHPGDPDLGPLAELQRRLADAPPGPRARAAWAWAKAMVDVGDDEAAAKALDAAAALRTKLAVMEMESFDAAWRGTVDALPFETLEAASGSAGARVTFILGPQRSGTTLVDQILTSHPAVSGGGELGFLPLMRHALGDFTAGPLSAFLGQQRAAGAGDPWAAIRERYFSLADERFGPGARFDDKLLSNHYRLAVIRCAFPGARVIRLRRDPLEVAWSCWRANFPLESAWTSSPQWLAAYLANYERIMDTWCARHPRWILEVDYARLVTAPDLEIPRILEFCGLPDAAATRSPHLNPRGVSTSSFAQVRQPIHAGRIGAARDFPQATAALRAALAAEGLRFAE